MAPWTLYLLFWTMLLTYLLGLWRLHWANKDGGPYSKVRMWGFESRRFGSLLVLCFGAGSREAYHSHAFNSVSWVLSGGLEENFIEGQRLFHYASPRPVFTKREHVHKVYGLCADTWVFTLRGPWSDTWFEVVDNKLVRLTHGRKVVAL